MNFVQVAIAVPLPQLFTYSVPEGMNALPGSRVFVPFHHRTVVGYVIDVSQDRTLAGSRDRKTFEIKSIHEVAEGGPVFSAKMLELIRWMSDYYCVSIGEMCKTALPALLTKRTKKSKNSRQLKETIIDDIFLSAPNFKLIPSQENAYKEIKSQISDLKFQTTLLHGITGSGKTEVYLRLFADVLESGKSALFLVPEIGITPQAVGRLTARFGDKVAVYHSGLTDARRLHEWQRMKDGKAKIVIGTRSAVFAPFENLGLIVVDEEHDPSYKQDENPRYNGRDVAVMRAKIENIPCVLGSATPSIESFSNTKSKKYHYIHLPDRPTGGLLPDVEIVDMREVPKGAALSPQMINAIGESLEKKEQIILFLNRRGFANFVLCTDCGHAYLCPNCNITLAYHKYEKQLLCHFCEYHSPLPNHCVKCNSVNVKQIGTGTEKIESEIKQYFPKAKVERFDRDTTLKVGARPKILHSMKSKETDVLIGTQMVTKGHDFPNVTLVGVIDADLSLNFPDFRAPERTFQLITQVAGRAGRGDLKGKVVVQTYSPEHYAIKSASHHDFFEFCNEELPQRKELMYPPFGRLALIKIQGANNSVCEKYANDIFKLITNHKSPVTFLGPSPAPISKIRSNYRWHILAKSNDIKGIRHVSELVNRLAVKPPRGIKVMVDVDPINML